MYRNRVHVGMIGKTGELMYNTGKWTDNLRGRGIRLY